MKSLTLAVVLAAAVLPTFSSKAHAYYGGYNNGNVIAGAIVGTVVGTWLNNVLQPRITYVYSQPLYAQPAVPSVAPIAPYLYYPPPRACVTVRVPVYDTGGRLIEYVQQCAN